MFEIDYDEVMEDRIIARLAYARAIERDKRIMKLLKPYLGS